MISATRIVGSEEPPARRYKFDRYCWECGKKVCSYKDPELDAVYCYEHDYLQPWTYETLVGRAADRYYQPRLTDNGKGRGNWSDREGYDGL